MQDYANNYADNAICIIHSQDQTHKKICKLDEMDQHERLIAARKAAGFATASEAARALDVREPTYLSHENGTRGYGRQADRYARRFGVNVEWLLYGRGKGPDGTLHAAHAMEPQPLPQPAMQPSERPPYDGAFSRDVPVIGTAAGSIIRKDFEGMLIEEPIEYVRRPPALTSARDLYAVYVTGESMEPEHGPGVLRFVHPHRQPLIGDTVIAVTRAHDDDPGQAYIKRLKKRTAEHLVLEQHTPHAFIEIPLKYVISLHKVLTTNELFGV
ncbi:helix-turn-helix transcriptional regulator [Stappia sp. F7233]|uniref:Helix-turn-helix transcriptional regulator n=1 Tax=Stappia albiluteola TaxID=2758565 RepID=A0A839AH40_9HYPH|nr:helix-turn-helix transcriptional regulator [Stappia albiluteola]MBA5778222.1 helix-turn-helix transcriptional regulator [Stappia albiluteola]